MKEMTAAPRDFRVHGKESSIFRVRVFAQNPREALGCPAWLMLPRTSLGSVAGLRPGLAQLGFLSHLSSSLCLVWGSVS